ncbi:signal peptidase I [Limosilactobacillus equigenerosi]|uniref:Signal peptidase I n=1 Tax=Limosilactobacillus equigenerosi DSM 18793 = JCM 14505 TaxID=1423742 RepID=A0A0R1UPE7_9LACO|nr:signal peptidase I [Limosilactobacillus equigenerosi]KRL95121.1 putative signal peptidase I [Limosilactobacillus equigenerosi DSM 18793 = JCM 14505]
MKLLREFLSWLWPIVLGLAVAGGMMLVVQRVRVDGPSMQPNLQNNERVWVLKHAKIHRGSVVVFDAQGVDPQATTKTNYVKRVIGVPGDTVRVKDGQLYVNNKRVKQSYISKYQRTTGTGNWDLASISVKNGWTVNNGATKVPAGQYFVMGDHRSVSNDSRYWGFVPRQKIMGVVKLMPWTGNATTRYNINKFWQHYFE